MSAVRNKGIFRWFFFLWLFIHRANASQCFCTPGDSSTPVHSRPHSASETVGFMESKTCFNGIFQTGMEWIRVDKTEIFIRKHSLTACPDGLVQITSGIHHTRNGFETLKTEKATNSRLRREERRFLLDSVNHAQCDFEVKSFCSWRNIQGGHDDFDWVLYQSSTPTDDTGPTFDHTLNNATGSYIFIESSAPRSTLDTAWIQSPEIDATVVPVHCFRFWYHMFGSSIGRLNIYQVTHGSLPGNLVWSLTGAQGSTWMKGQVPLSSNRNYSVLISGIVGNGYQGDIAIDDVSVSPGYCDVKPSIASRTNVTNTATTTTATTTTTTTLPTTTTTQSTTTPTTTTTTTTPAPKTTAVTAAATTTQTTTSTALPTTTTTFVTTTAPTSAETSRKCHVCRGTPQICEQLYVLQECPADKQFCINELTNKEDASRTVNRRCGTQDECDNGWYQTYSDDDKCIFFDEKLVYDTDFYCEYCCNEDGCNKLVNPPITWSP